MRIQTKYVWANLFRRSPDIATTLDPHCDCLCAGSANVAQGVVHQRFVCSCQHVYDFHPQEHSRSFVSVRRMSGRTVWLPVFDWGTQSSLIVRASSSSITFIHSHFVLSSFEKSFHAIRQLLKPTGKASVSIIHGRSGLIHLTFKFAIFEWCWTCTFDIHNPDHCRLAELVELTTHIGHRAPHERTIHAALIAFQDSGLQLLHHEDLAAREDKIPWYSPLEAAMSGPSTVWQPETNAFGGLSKPAANALIEAGRHQVSDGRNHRFIRLRFIKFFTPMALFVGQKLLPDVSDYDQVQL